jgi:hypothetical protein
MGSNLMHVSIIVIESGAFYYYSLAIENRGFIRTSGAVYLSVLACVVASYTMKSLLFNIFLDIVSATYNLLA